MHEDKKLFRDSIYFAEWFYIALTRHFSPHHQFGYFRPLMIRINLFLTLLVSPLLIFAQSSVKDSSISMLMIRPGIGLQMPGGDLSKRFGNNAVISMDVTYKHRKKWMLNAEGSFIFSNKIKQANLFTHLINDQGIIIGDDGRVADIRVYERGYYITISSGLLFNFKKPNPNCGIFVTTGVGYIQHKIRVEDYTKTVPALRDDYKKGYDRLTNGICLHESVGYLFISNYRLVNFYFAADAVQGFTKSRRTYNFDDMGSENNQRLDLLFGARIGWVLPLYRQAPEKFYIY